MTKSNLSQKKLKAIVFTDMADFTTISAQDEDKALDLIQKQNEIIKPIVEKHNGEWLKEIGDGLLFSFDSSIEAVRCSIEIQENLKDIDDLNIRIGIHQGDIFIKDSDVFGDDVNIASRVEGFAPIGGISISDKVHKDISGVSDIKTSFIGHRNLKGVEQETKIRCITSHNLPVNHTSIAAKIAAYLCFFMSAYHLLIVVYVGLTLPMVDLSEEMLDIISYKELYIKLFYSSTFGISSLLIGYSCLSYYKGLSIKSQKWLVYLAYLYFIIPVIRVTTNFLYNDKTEDLLTALADANIPVPQLFLIIILNIIILPIIIITLFRKYYFMKKHSSLKIFKRDGLALLLLLIFIVLYAVFTFSMIFNEYIIYEHL